MWQQPHADCKLYLAAACQMKGLPLEGWAGGALEVLALEGWAKLPRPQPLPRPPVVWDATLGAKLVKFQEPHPWPPRPREVLYCCFNY